MGAGKPGLNPTESKPPKSNWHTFVEAAVVLVALAVPALIYFAQPSEFPALAPHEEAKLQKRLKEIDDAVQYALIANENGLYPCNHPGRPAFHLHGGEVWKYGTTTKGQVGRYSFKYLEKTNVSFVVQFRGTIAECLKEEQRKLFNYPYLPENLARPPADRLPRPPFNSKMQ